MILIWYHTYPWRTKLLTTPSGHAQSVWSPIGCEGYYFKLRQILSLTQTRCIHINDSSWLGNMLVMLFSLGWPQIQIAKSIAGKVSTCFTVAIFSSKVVYFVLQITFLWRETLLLLPCSISADNPVRLMTKVIIMAIQCFSKNPRWNKAQNPYQTNFFHGLKQNNA